MKKIFITLCLSIACIILNAQYQTDTRFANNEYFINPVFAGDYPDPSIMREGDDFYLVHSSFEYYPGLLIWHSTDLINWTPVANALHKYVGSVWAPDLVKYDEKYFIYFPASGTNYVVSADNIAGPWSDPVELKVHMIDPGHVVDEKGNRYLYFSSGSYVPLSKDGLSIAGEIKQSYYGWEIPRDWTIECFCLEGPKLFKRGSYYYLTVAEGGTAGPATGHMVISARSKTPFGPWENAPHNPVLRAKSAEDKWWSVGHATIFNDAKDNWYMIFHGYENGFYNMGRQTLIVPVEWTEDGWYKIPDNIDLAKPIKLPDLENKSKETYVLNDAFYGSGLNPQWKFFKGSDKDRYKLDNGSIVINGKGNFVADCSPMLIIPPDHSYTAQVELEIEDDTIGGVVLFYSEKISSGILADKENVLANLRGWQFPAEKNVINRHVFLRLKNINHTVDMYYSIDGKKWTKIENSFESSAYHHNVLSGFMSLRIGLCSIGEGKVRFRNFEYEPLK
jgi:xylan 1,4-beta-xylosidase